MKKNTAFVFFSFSSLFENFEENQPEPTTTQNNNNNNYNNNNYNNNNPAGSEVYLILQNDPPVNDLSSYFNNLVETDRNAITNKEPNCGAVENMDNLSRSVPGPYGILN